MKVSKGVFAYTEKGLELDKKIHNAIYPLIKEYTEKGYNQLELNYIFNSNVDGVLAEQRIICNVKIRKKNCEVNNET